MVLVTICYLFLFSFAQASDTVSVSSNLEGLVQVSRSPRQHLPSGPQALIKWAGEHGYSPVTSYTSTPVANHFNIRLREPGKLKTQEETTAGMIWSRHSFLHCLHSSQETSLKM